MKSKCPECGTGKARRRCHRVGDVEICSACCAGMRDPDCGDCPHYAVAARYEANRRRNSGLGPGDFMMEISPEVTEAVDEALKAVERGDLAQPMDDLKDLLRDHPLHDGVSYGIGVIHGLRGEIRESIGWFERAIEINPFNLEAHFNRAVSFQKLFDVVRCIRGYQKVVAIGEVDDPAVVQARSLIKDLSKSIEKSYGVRMEDYLRSAELFEEAFEWMESGDWSGALKGFRASATINDRSAPCHGNMGLCLAQLGRKAEAIAAFERALEIDPDYEPAMSNLKIALKMDEGKPLEDVEYQSISFAEEQWEQRHSTESDSSDGERRP
jgi:tetratricopeptide (TPR) repeat protein